MAEETTTPATHAGASRDAADTDQTAGDSLRERAQKKPAGIEGWLLIPFFGLLIGAVDHTFTVIDNPLPKASVEIMAGNLVLAAGSVVLFTLLCKKHSMVPMLMIVYAVTDLAIHTLQFVATTTPLLGIGPELAAQEAPRVLEGLRTTVMFWVIFVPYFLVSERVKNTFVND